MNISDGPNSFRIVPITEAPLEQVLVALDQTFGPGHNETWFTWKHLDNPYGQTLGWVACDEAGIMGIRLFMRWNLQVSRRIVRAVRPVDTATVARARKQGVFRALTEFAIKAVVEDPEIDLIFNTPNENSRLGYVRMGWTTLPPLTHGVYPILPGRIASIEHGEMTFKAFNQTTPDSHQLSSYRNAEVLQWRYDERSGISYGQAHLRQAESPNGIIYRVIRRWGIHLLVVNELIGTLKERHLLLRSVAYCEGALAALMTTGPGAFNLIQGLRIRRGSSILAVRPLRVNHPDPTYLNNWALTLGDLERII